jgi:hypothetical protein
MDSAMTDDQLRTILNEELAKFAGQMFRHFDERFGTLRDELKTDINQVLNTVDGIANRLDTDEQERAAMNRQLARHQRWHEQTVAKLGMKLDYQEE